MKKSLAQLAVGAALLMTVVPTVSAQEMQGRAFGGVETGVMIPLNAFDRFASIGGLIRPYVGYKLFDDKDLQLNPGLVGSLQFLGAPGEDCCTRINPNGLPFAGSKDTYALGYNIGPRLSLPVGPVELYGDWQVGGMTGLASGSAITDTSWGFTTGGGVLYGLNENVSLGLYGRWSRYYQRSHGVGDVRYADTGINLMVQQSPPPPPPPPAPPVAQAPPPPPPMKKKIVLRGVNFDFDKYNIRPDAVPILEQACKTLKDEPGIDVYLDGHTDSVGTPQYNQGLSERRADSVRNWLIKCGVSGSRMTARGFGEANPVASNATAEGRAQNRRTEIIVK